MKGLVFTYLLAYGGAVVALFRPYWGFLAYVILAILRPEGLWQFAFGSYGHGFSQVVAIGLLLGWALHGCGNWRLRRAWPLVICLAGFCLWSLLSAAQAVADKEAAFRQVEAYAKVLLPFIVGLTLINTINQLKALAWVIVICHGYVAFEFNLHYYKMPEFVAAEWNFAGLDNNGIALTMATAAGPAFFMGLSASRWWQKVGCFLAAALLVHVVLFSESRGAMLALIVTGVVSFLIMPKRPAHLVFLLIAVLVGLRLAGPTVVNRFMTIFAEQLDDSAESRLVLWGQCLQVMSENFLFGIGPQNWEKITPALGWEKNKSGHTTWLETGAETGIVGLGFLALFYLICLTRMLPYVRERTPTVDPWLHGLARMVISSLVGFAVAAQFVSVHGVEAPYYCVLLGAALLKLQPPRTRPAAALVPLVPVPAYRAF